MTDFSARLLVAVNCSIQASSDRYSGSKDIVNPERGTNQYSCEQTVAARVALRFLF